MKKRKLIFRIVFWLVVVSFLVWLVLFGGRFQILDFVTGFGYEPGPSELTIYNHLSLTGRAQRIFRGARVEIQDADAFNESCSTKKDSNSTLGCYSNGRIYIYNIEHTELAGVEESIAAHELLHAAWSHLSSWEQDSLETEMQKAYADHYDELVEYMELYGEDDFADELHSRLGTQIEPSRLPKTLRDHYAQYFNDPQQIYEYYLQYNSKFTAMKQECDALYEKIEELRATIDRKRQEYETTSEKLGRDIDTFNARAANGYYSDRTMFDKDRAALVARQKVLSELYQELDDLVDEINRNIDRYNENILHASELRQVMNSNAADSAGTISN